MWFQDVQIKKNFMGQILLNTTCAQGNWNWWQLDAVSEGGIGKENDNVKRRSYKNRQDLVLWMKEETILNVVWEREKQREVEKLTQ